MKNNGRAPLKASDFKPDLINLRPGHRSAVCPDCKTWRTVQNRMITAHRAEPHSGQPRHRRDENHVSRCPGSGQRIWFDITPEQWQARYDRLANRRQNQAMDAGARHTTRVKRMGSAVAPPVSKVIPSPLTAAVALKAYRAHCEECAACPGRAGCTDGARLAALYTRLQRQEPKRQRTREGMEQLREQAERHLTEQLPRRRMAEWAAVIPDVQAADKQRAQLPDGDAPAEGPGLPLLKNPAA
ncbi:hypothetical protein ABIE67_009574 [Streptomyces sp. V4I8]|uniref:hypothetical protein n=1 Tax=Streptomyces sp. V4I8 TaxID=3156469 RepID=UPI0035181754